VAEEPDATGYMTVDRRKRWFYHCSLCKTIIGDHGSRGNGRDLRSMVERAAEAGRLHQANRHAG
jgi:hypothetical protein